MARKSQRRRCLNLKWIKEYMDIRNDKHKKKWDSVIGIVGPEGVGKSNLGLHQLEYWMELKNGKCDPDDVKHMSMKGKDFVDDLSEADKMDCVVFDEAGELDNRRALSNFNVMLSQAYKVIRADNIYTILILPDIFDLEFRFIKRMKALFFVYQRGRVAVWLKDSLVKMAELNAYRKVKNVRFVRPDFYDTFPIYKGVMEESYAKRKAEKTKEARKELKHALNSKEEIGVRAQKMMNMAYNLKQRKFKIKEIAEIMDVTPRRIAQILKESREKKKV